MPFPDTWLTGRYKVHPRKGGAQYREAGPRLGCLKDRGLALGKGKPDTKGATDLVEPNRMGRQFKKPSIIALTLIVVGLFLLLLVVPVLADDPPAPDNLQIESVKVFHNVIEEDDFTLVFHYNIHYSAANQPDDPANKLFTFRLLDTDGVDHLAAIVPYAFYNSGYDQGCAAFYFSPDAPPDWELSYIVRISGNPEYFSSPPLVSRTLISSDYSQVNTQEENQTQLGYYIFDIASDLASNWSTPLFYTGDLGQVLNTTGESYFKGAIPGLQVMAPQIFAIQTTNPQYTPTEWTEAKGKAYEEQFENTWVGKSLEDLGNLFHIKWTVLTGMMILGVIIAIAVWCQWKYSTTKPVLIAGAIVIVGGTRIGFVAPAIMAITTILFALFLGYVWMFRHG